MIRKILFFILISFLAKAENDADFKQRFAEMEEIIKTMQKVIRISNTKKTIYNDEITRWRYRVTQ